MLLWFNGLIWLLFGLMFLVEPNGAFAWATGDELSTAVAHTELRAMYGGICTALGVVFSWCAYHRPLRYPGIQLMLVIYLGLASFRLIGIIVDGTHESDKMWKFFGAEVLVLVLAINALRHSSKEK